MTELTDRGVALWEEGGLLRFRAPSGVLTEDHKSRMRAQKQGLLDLLRAATTPVVTADPEHRHEPFPLTDVQSAYLLGRGAAFELGGVGCHVYMEVAWPDVDPRRLDRAWHRLIERHDMLRAVIDEDGAQRVLPEIPLRSVPVTDLRAGGDVEAALRAVRAELDHRVHPVGGPMYDLRATRTPDGAVLHLSMDFLVSDWAGISLLLGELATLHADPDAVLAPIGIGFRDYVLAERALRDTPAYQRDRDYWTSRVDDLPPGPDLPLAARGRSTPRFHRHTVHLDPTCWDAFQSRARARGLTPSTAVLGAYAAVIERWSRNPRFALNLTVLNRMPLHADVEKMIGDFTTVSLLAVEPAGGASFAEHAAATGSRMFDDLDHRLYSGVEVLREVHRRRGRDAALMPVVFTSAIGLAQVMASRIGYGVTQTPQVHIDCQAGDSDAGLQVNWDVRDGVFPAGVVEDMFAAFGELLTALAGSDQPWDAPATAVVALPDRQRAERRAANATAVATPPSTLHGPVFARAAAAPDRTAVITPSATLTYGELATRADAVAAALQAAGCRPGERVAIVMDKGADQVVAVLGALRAGAVYVPVDTTSPAPRRAAMLADAGVRCVLTQGGTDVGELTAIVVADLPGATAEPGETDPADPAYVIFTSGSTGRPKGVVMAHRAAANTIADINRRFAVTADDRVLGLANLGFDLSVYDLFGPLWTGGALVLPDPARRTDPSHWAELVAAHGVTVWDTVPALMQMLTTYLGTDPRPLPSLRLAMLSGDWIPVSLPGEMATLLPGCTVAALGGATEAAIWSNVHVVDPGSVNPGSVDTGDPDWPSIPYGRPLANQTFRVLDGALRDCPEWTAGELCIGGAGLADGYLGDADLTAARFFTHPDGERLYRTGDLGRYRPGAVLEFLGREDTQVKVRGHRIELGEIEAALQAHPQVAAAAVTVGGTGPARRLLGAVEPARIAPVIADLDRITRVAATAADRTAAGIEAATVARAVAELDAAVFGAMVRALDALGLLADPVTSDGIAAAVHERHRWLVRRWLDVLVDAGLLVAADGGFTCPAVPADTFDQAEETWRRIDTPGFVGYVRSNAERLPALLTGEQDPVELLFPEGGLEVAAALYRDHAMARYLNRAVAAVVHRAAAAQEGRLRVLEVGAGTGGTTGDVLDALAGFDVDYLYTDVSGFFLPAARARFGDLVRYGTFDVDADVRAQGLAPNAFDVVLAAGVLENARDIPAALGRLTELAAPGGWLVLTEPTREHPWILASQAFMMTPPEDDRAHGASYLDAQQWADALGGDSVLRLPADDHPLAPMGLHLFATQVKTDRAGVDGVALTRFLAARLPQHMVPAQLDVVDALPLTGNGKVDRAAIAAWRRDGATIEAPAAGAEPADELEAELAKHWAAALGLARIGRTDSFFTHGADSLIMAQMAGRLREELPAAAPVPFDTLLRHMLARPDVAAVAEFLRAPAVPEVPAGQRGAGSNALLMPFSVGDTAAPLRVMFHAGLGTMECYRPLAARLVAQDLGPVTGIAIADADAFVGLEPAQVVEHLADDYAQRLAETGHTRFQLIGYCLGGMYATEVARRLAERGLEVADLVLVSSHPVVVDVDDELMIETVFVPNLHIGLAEAGFGPVDAGAAVQAFGEIADANGGRLPAGSLAGIEGELGAFFRRLAAVSREERFASYAHAAGVPVELVSGMHRMFRQSFLSARFTPPPYAGDIRFLRPTGPFAFAPGMDSATLTFWRDVCLGSFALTDVGGDHFSCVEEPVVAEVAAHIGSALVRR